MLNAARNSSAYMDQFAHGLATVINLIDPDSPAKRSS
jgi:hypothetical protein